MVVWVRSLLFNIWFFFWTFAVAFFLLPLLLARPRVVAKSGVVWAYGVLLGLRILCGIKMEVRGREYIPKGAAIVASKHQSAWETAMFYLFLPFPAYILKKEIAYIPLFGWYTKRIKTIAVDRSAGAKALKDMVAQVKDRLASGRQIIIFPEGTRKKPGEHVEKYQPGIAAIYNQVEAPLVPVALNSGLFWGKNAFHKTPGTVVIEFLPPVPGGLKKQEFMDELYHRIETASAKLYKEASAKKSG